ncbi:MAG TPA: TRAP transporter large permease subunit [Candidatus Didemnitutus sp.]|nr:TRAP transporter large permease subunit [Candidatus Didemnitutus sp.]
MADANAAARTAGRTGPVHVAENLLMTAALAVMAGLPLIEMALRAGWHSGVMGSSTIVQHLTLIVGMLGGGLAARDDRLLSLVGVTAFLSPEWKKRARWFSRACSTAVTALLCVASWQFVLAEKEGGADFLPGIPVWIVQCALPIGFAVVTLRLLYHASDGWRGRVLAALLAAGLVALGIWPPLSPAALVWPGLALVLVAAALGAPIFVALGGAGLILFWGADQPIAALPVEHYRLVVNPALPSIPLFTLAGYFMAEGGASRRLVRVFQALVGWFRGGPAIATALLCAFFTSLTGGSGVTILALGGLLMPVLIAARYTERDALGLLTGAGSLGILLPPCLPVILYAIVAKVGIKEMFLGGLLPGLLLIGMTAAWGIWAGRAGAQERKNFDATEAWAAVKDAKWELLLPLVAPGTLFGGWATPVEAAAVTAIYAFVIEVFVHRDLRLVRDCPRVMTEAGVLIGGILLILGVALGLTNYLIDAQVPDTLAAWAAENVTSRWLFLLGLNVVLLVVGSIVEIYAAIVVIVPLLVPIGQRLGLHPVHLGIIFLANMELGFLMPPVGLNLLLASSRLEKSIGETTRAVLPLLLVMFIGVLLITYWPALTLGLLP